VTGGETTCEGACVALEKKTVDSATSHEHDQDGTKKFSHRRTAAVDGNFWKRDFLHQRIRNWQLCPDSIDKVGIAVTRNVRRILVRWSMPPCRLRRRKFRKFDYEMVHSEVYLNKYVVSIAPFSTSACSDCTQNITVT